ncbi:hypothetical protein C0995_001135 [Termitomyces sp. Mi166|nr:hypothetical protein C0995_001135 [Termitomyces sp. Mi166\
MLFFVFSPRPREVNSSPGDSSSGIRASRRRRPALPRLTEHEHESRCLYHHAPPIATSSPRAHEHRIRGLTCTIINGFYYYSSHSLTPLPPALPQPAEQERHILSPHRPLHAFIPAPTTYRSPPLASDRLWEAPGRATSSPRVHEGDVRELACTIPDTPSAVTYDYSLPRLLTPHHSRRLVSERASRHHDDKPPPRRQAATTTTSRERPFTPTSPPVPEALLAMELDCRNHQNLPSPHRRSTNTTFVDSPACHYSLFFPFVQFLESGHVDEASFASSRTHATTTAFNTTPPPPRVRTCTHDVPKPSPRIRSTAGGHTKFHVITASPRTACSWTRVHGSTHSVRALPMNPRAHATTTNFHHLVRPATGSYKPPAFRSFALASVRLREALPTATLSPRVHKRDVRGLVGMPPVHVIHGVRCRSAYSLTPLAPAEACALAHDPMSPRLPLTTLSALPQTPAMPEVLPSIPFDGGRPPQVPLSSLHGHERCNEPLGHRLRPASMYTPPITSASNRLKGKFDEENDRSLAVPDLYEHASMGTTSRIFSSLTTGSHVLTTRPLSL